MAERIGAHPKSLVRMLSRDGNPTAAAISGIIAKLADVLAADIDIRC